MHDTKELIELIFTMNRLTKEGIEHGKGAPSYIQLQTLSFISQKKNPSMKDIADCLNITPPSTTSLINNLIKLNLVVRVNDKNDKRIIRLSITTQGKKELQKGFARSKKYLHKKLDLLSAKEQQSFIQILKKLSLIVNSK